MKKVILGFAVIMLAVVAIGCSKSSSPKAVVTTYLQAMKSKDYKKAADCFYIEGTKEEVEEAKSQLVDLIEKGGESVEEKGGIKSFKINSVEENGDKAVVKGEVIYGNGEVKDDEVIEVKKVNGQWYIDMDK